TNSWETPFSKRADASLRRFSRLLVFLMDTGLKSADSMRTLTVFSVTSEKFPPITPASAMGSLPFVMTMSLSMRLRSLPSSVVIFSFWRQTASLFHQSRSYHDQTYEAAVRIQAAHSLKYPPRY